MAEHVAARRKATESSSTCREGRAQDPPGPPLRISLSTAYLYPLKHLVKYNH